jgi:hypothetical protein
MVSSSASRRAAIVVAVAAAATLVTLAAVGGRLTGPAVFRFAPPCLFHELTGLYCPGCGSTRAFLHLVHGQPIAALQSNPLLGVAVPLLLLAIIEPYETRAGRWRLRSFLYHPVTGWSLVSVVVLFGVLRNLRLPLFRWLSP